MGLISWLKSKFKKNDQVKEEEKKEEVEESVSSDTSIEETQHQIQEDVVNDTFSEENTLEDIIKDDKLDTRLDANLSTSQDIEETSDITADIQIEDNTLLDELVASPAIEQEETVEEITKVLEDEIQTGFDESEEIQESTTEIEDTEGDNSIEEAKIDEIEEEDTSVEEGTESIILGEEIKKDSVEEIVLDKEEIKKDSSQQEELKSSNELPNNEIDKDSPTLENKEKESKIESKPEVKNNFKDVVKNIFPTNNLSRQEEPKNTQQTVEDLAKNLNDDEFKELLDSLNEDEEENTDNSSKSKNNDSKKEFDGRDKHGRTKEERAKERQKELEEELKQKRKEAEEKKKEEKRQEKEQQKIVDEKYVAGLDKSRQGFTYKLNKLAKEIKEANSAYFDGLERILIEADVGVRLTLELLDQVEKECQATGITDTNQINELLVDKMFVGYLNQGGSYQTDLVFRKEGPTVLMVVGVNGTGKTTTIAKLAKRYKEKGKRILLVAGDTFRAGAIEQLDLWAKRVDVDIYKTKEGADPASTCYEGLTLAKKENYDLVIIDTAGRLHNKTYLMDELGKVVRVIKKVDAEAPHETFLVIDANTGQNGIEQAKVFKEVTSLSGVVITKMDGTSKGGIILAIRDNIGVPVRFIGLGEKMDDLREFDLDQYLYGLLVGGE